MNKIWDLNKRPSEHHSDALATKPLQLTSELLMITNRAYVNYFMSWDGHADPSTKLRSTAAKQMNIIAD